MNRKQMLLIEAETFADRGGWVLDTQFFETVGSAYLMAHGLGRPVRDAVAKKCFPEAGRYRLFVRTRDWAPGSPGAFDVSFNGRPAGAVFGTDGNPKWHWQAGGVVETAPVTRIALCDRTGFGARCDALLLVPEEAGAFAPPEDGAELETFRRSLLGIPEEPEEGGDYDFVVSGGGFAGLSAAVTAARHGLKVALVQDRTVFGGCGSDEIRVHPIHKLDEWYYPRNSDLMRELLSDDTVWAYTDLNRADERRRRIAEAEPNLTLFMSSRTVGVEMAGTSISSVIVQDLLSGRRTRLKAALFADCTGDSIVGAVAGAEFRLGRESRSEFDEPFAPEKADSMLLGNTLYWFAVEEGKKTDFPSCPWALKIDRDEHWQVPRPLIDQKLAPGVTFACGWNWEVGFNQDNILEGEDIRDHLLRAIFGTWDYIKNKSPEKDRYATSSLGWVGYVLGKRESRRLLGDFLLTQNHLLRHEVEPDGCVATAWYLDLHYPHPDNGKFFPGREFRSIAYDDPQWDARYSFVAPGTYREIEPYPIPYRCLYSRNIPNLFMAGRNLSATHAGLSSPRTMLCTGQMGVVVGRAAALCRARDCSPRDIYEKHLDEFLGLLKDPGTPKKKLLDRSKLRAR